MNDDGPLFVPAEFERDHLEDARRRVAGAGRGSSVTHRARRLLVATQARPMGRHLGVAAAVHGLALLLAFAAAAVTATWDVGLAVTGIVLVSFAATVVGIRVLERRRRAARPGPLD